MDIASVPLQLSCDVSCCRLSAAAPKGVRLVGYGGYDKNAHVFAFGESSRRCSLGGHSTAVTSLAFANDLTRAVGGSDGGSIRLWDLNNEECIRTFGTGHKSTVTDCDYHLFGEFIGTCSRDSTLRVWDLRKKACLQAYKDAGCELKVVRFCPSGRWVASGGADGVIRMYDLTSGKKIKDLVAHTAAIESLSFHDTMFYLAAGSQDGTTSLWELDNFTKVYQSGGNRAVTAVVTTGQSLFSASSNCLKHYSYDLLSDRNATVTETPWGSCGEIVYDAATDAVLGVDFQRNLTTTYYVKCNSQVPKPKIAPVVSRIDARETGAQKSAGAPSGSKFSHSSTPAAVEARIDSKPSGNRLAELRKKHADLMKEQEAAKHEDPRMQALMRGERTANPMIPAPQDPTPNVPRPSSAHQPPPSHSKSSHEITDALSRNSASMLSVLQRRLTHARVFRTQWPREAQHALRTLNQIAMDDNDAGAVVDFLHSMKEQRMKESLTFEMVPQLLELIVNVLEHQRNGSAVLPSLKLARTVNNKFRAKIDEGIRGAQFLNGKDLSGEARVAKAREAQERFDELYAHVSEFVSRSDEIGEEARTLLAELPKPIPKKKNRF